MQTSTHVCPWLHVSPFPFFPDWRGQLPKHPILIFIYAHRSDFTTAVSHPGIQLSGAWYLRTLPFFILVYRVTGQCWNLTSFVFRESCYGHSAVNADLEGTGLTLQYDFTQSQIKRGIWWNCQYLYYKFSIIIFSIPLFTDIVLPYSLLLASRFTRNTVLSHKWALIKST